MPAGRSSNESRKWSYAAVWLARRLRAMRTQRGLSQEGLAQRAGIDVGTYSKLERGLSDGQPANPTLSTIVLTLDALDASVDIVSPEDRAEDESIQAEDSFGESPDRNL